MQEWLALVKPDDLLTVRACICGDRLTLAGILLFCLVDFFDDIKRRINWDDQNIVAWHACVKARPSRAIDPYTALTAGHGISTPRQG